MLENAKLCKHQSRKFVLPFYFKFYYSLRLQSYLHSHSIALDSLVGYSLVLHWYCHRQSSYETMKLKNRFPASNTSWAHSKTKTLSHKSDFRLMNFVVTCVEHAGDRHTHIHIERQHYIRRNSKHNPFKKGLQLAKKNVECSTFKLLFCIKHQFRHLHDGENDYAIAHKKSLYSIVRRFFWHFIDFLSSIYIRKINLFSRNSTETLSNSFSMCKKKMLAFTANGLAVILYRYKKNNTILSSSSSWFFLEKKIFTQKFNRKTVERTHKGARRFYAE